MHPTGSVRGDLLALAQLFVDLLLNTTTGRVLPRMIGEIATGSPLGRRYADSVIRPRRGLAAELFRRGMARGELPPDLNVELAVDALFGPIIVRRLLAGERIADDFAERLVHGVLHGLGVPSPEA